MKKLLACLSFTALLLTASPVFAEELSIVTLYSPPLAYEKGGVVKGMATEIVQEALRRMGIKASFSIMPWTRAVFMTRFGEADAIYYAVRNKEREDWFHYPDVALLTEATVMVKRKGQNVSITANRYNYESYRIGIERGYYYGPKLENFLNKSKFSKVEEATTIESNFSKLIQGRIDIFLADHTLANYFLKKQSANSLVEIVCDEAGDPIMLDAVASYLAFSKKTINKEVAEAFSRELAKMKQDGTYYTIVNKYR